MLAVFIDSDTDAARKKSVALVKEWRKKVGEAEIIKLDDRLTLAELEELAESQRLFSPALVAEGSFVFESPTIREQADKVAAKLSASPHHFALIERDAPAELAKILKKHADTFEENKTKKEKPRGDFSFSDAFASRDRKNLWTTYRIRLLAGASAEELHSQLFWQVKTMILIAGGNEAGMHPYVVQKTKKFLKNYSIEELRQAAYDLALVYHDSHQSGEGLESALEKFILAL